MIRKQIIPSSEEVPINDVTRRVEIYSPPIDGVTPISILADGDLLEPSQATLEQYKQGEYPENCINKTIYIYRKDGNVNTIRFGSIPEEGTTIDYIIE